MSDNKIYTVGLIPYITAKDLEKLTDEGRAVITRELAKSQGQMTFQEDLTVGQIRELMDALEVAPIWGREGLVVYRLSVEGKIMTFGIAPDPAVDLIHPSVLTREFVACTSIQDLVTKMQYEVDTYPQGPGTPVIEILPEDHPEESSIGFICPQLNTVWLLHTDIVGENLKAGEVGPWAQVGHLIQSNQGRLALAFMLTQNKLQTMAEYMEQLAGMNALTPQPQQVIRRQQQEITIDLLSGKIAERYKERYLGKKVDQ